ncbi:MAG: nitroreductase family protein [Thiomonas sp.]
MPALRRRTEFSARNQGIVMSAISTHHRPSSDRGGRPAYAELTATLIHTRQQLAPKRLFAPGPNEAQLEAYFLAAAAAPDHGEILPWRFIVVTANSRAGLGEVFARALKKRDPAASDKELAEARDKAHRAPFVALAVVRHEADDHPEIPLAERLISLGVCRT